MMDVIRDRVETGGFAMEYFRFGEGERKLVILPGLSVQSVMHAAEAVAAAYAGLAEEFTIYVFDRRAQLPRSTLWRTWPGTRRRPWRPWASGRSVSSGPPREG